LICRFLLEIRQRNDHLNSISQPPLTVGSFHAVAQHIHNAVVDEFGDPSFDDSFEEDEADEIEPKDRHSHHMQFVVDLDEFPWAAGMSGGQVWT